MTPHQDDPTPETVDETAQATLCQFCRQRIGAFLARHEQYPNFTTTDALRMIGDFSRSCCAPRIAVRYGDRPQEAT